MFSIDQINYQESVLLSYNYPCSELPPVNLNTNHNKPDFIDNQEMALVSQNAYSLDPIASMNVVSSRVDQVNNLNIEMDSRTLVLLIWR